MALLLRKLARRSRWMVEADPNWLPDRDAPGPPLYDFIPDDHGKLSVWAVEEDKSNLARVVAAIAATRDSVDVLDYVLFDAKAACAAGAALEPAPGVSPDRGARQAWHRDLTKVSAQRAASLVCGAFLDGERTRALQKEVAELLNTAVTEGWLRLDDLHPKVKEKLQRAAGPGGSRGQGNRRPI